MPASATAIARSIPIPSSIPASPGPPAIRCRIAANEAVDRIDQIHALGNSTTTASQILGETGGPDFDIGIDPWPSDHHAVVSTFTVVPGAAPAMVSLREAQRHGRATSCGVRFHAATDDGRIEDGRIAIVASGGKAGGSRC